MRNIDRLYSKELLDKFVEFSKKVILKKQCSTDDDCPENHVCRNCRCHEYKKVI